MIDWSRIYYGESEPHSVCLSSPGMIGTIMTILVGMYSDDRTDIALIADRRISPTNEGKALGFVSRDYAIKTEALSCECAIGFTGNAIVQKLVLNHLEQIDLMGNMWTVDLLRNELDRWFANGTAQIPGMATAGIVIAGRFGRVSLLAYYDAKTGWTAKLVRAGSLYFSPILKTDISAQNEMDAKLNGLSGCYLDRLKSAVLFCAERYDSVNRNYIIRRLSNGFIEEEGTV